MLNRISAALSHIGAALLAVALVAGLALFVPPAPKPEAAVTRAISPRIVQQVVEICRSVCVTPASISTPPVADTGSYGRTARPVR